MRLRDLCRFLLCVVVFLRVPQNSVNRRPPPRPQARRQVSDRCMLDYQFADKQEWAANLFSRISCNSAWRAVALLRQQDRRGVLYFSVLCIVAFVDAS